MSRFIIFYKNKKIGEYLFSATEFSIGRSADNDIMLDDSVVARKQAIVKLVGNEYILSDLGSDNPTLINGETTISTALKNNDQIDIGPFRLHCQLEVFESLLQHLSSQIDPETGDTDPRVPGGNEHVRIRSDGRQVDEEDQFLEQLYSYGFYVGIVLLVIFVAAVVYLLLID
jgi:hypothetical protein